MEKERLEIRVAGFSEEDYKDWKNLGVEFLLYAQCYEETLSAILSNIDHNKSKQKKDDEYSSVYVGMKNEYVSPLDSSNIIAFMGNRGSGKTTAINEFSKILCNYYKNHDIWNRRLIYKPIESEYRFHILSPVDASVLEKKEDLMEVILANMYQAFQKRVNRITDRAELIREIVKEFNAVYQNYSSVGKTNDKRHPYEETVLARLEDISSTLKTKNSIRKLTESFLKLLSEKGEIENNYLVVVIDDLDMSPENGFAMLEQLHKYLSDQRIIILIAIKYEQMKIMCNQYFVDCLTPQYGGIHREVFNKFYERAKELSSDYLLKVLPFSNRIYMPESMLNKNGIIEEEQRKFTVKDYVLMRIASKMNIYYDAVGLKRHFCLPDTVRELVVYDNFLDSLHSMEEIAQWDGQQKERRMILYDQNHERFNGDIEYRMAMRVLDDEQLEVYRLIQKRSLERRAKYAVNFLHAWTEERKNKKNRSMKDKVDGQAYSYTDLLETIYHLGRDNYKDKSLVHCILASFTSEMVREYYSYMNNVSKERKAHAAERLKCLLGNTFGGKWFSDVMPGISGLHGSGTENLVVYLKDKHMANFNFDTKQILILPGENRDEVIMRVLSDIVPLMERLMLLYFNYRDINGKAVEPVWDFDLKIGDSEEGYAIALGINSKIAMADYDIWGFIGREIEAKVDEHKGRTNNLTEALASCLREKLPEMGYVDREISLIAKELKRRISKKSIWNQYDRNRNIAFPYYNLDLSYNIMKRVRSNLSENVLLKNLSVYGYLCTVYSYVAEELYKEEMAYNDILSPSKGPTFLYDFVGSPFMKAFEIKIGAKPYNEQDPEKREYTEHFFNESIGRLGEDITKSGLDEHNIYS